MEARDGWLPHFAEASALFAPIAPLARPLAARPRWPTVEELSSALEASAGVRFVLQPPRGRRRRGPTSLDAMYDEQIARGVVPTRARSWHDLLNALVWGRFPRAKRALHARQAQAIAARFDALLGRVAPTRTAEQDALAMLDEGGVVLLCGRDDEAGTRAMTAAMDDAAVAARLREGRLAAVVFGHALYEGLVLAGPPAIAAACVIGCDEPVPASVDARCALVDARLAALFDDGFPASRDELGHVALAALVT